MRTRRILLTAILAMVGFCTQVSAQQDLETALAQIVTHMSQQMKKSQVSKVAIVPLPDLNGYQSALGEFIAEELITQIFTQNPGEFDVVERRQLAKVLAEQQLSTTSLFEPRNISALGKILGVDAIVTGSIADLGTEVKINARAIAVSSAKIFAAASGRAVKDETVKSLMMQNAPPQGTDVSTGRSLIQRSNVYFSNSFLRAGVAQIGRSGDSKQIVLALSLENLTSSDLLLALEMESFYSRCAARIVDSRGNYFATQRNGVSGLTCLGHRETGVPDKYTLLSAKSKTTITITFVAPVSAADWWGTRSPSNSSAEETEVLLSFAANFVKFDKKKATRFAVGIGNIQFSP